MRGLFVACVALFLCAEPTAAQTCRTAEAQLQVWNGAVGNLRVAEWTEKAAKLIVEQYNMIPPVSDYKADKVQIATSPNTPGQGAILFSFEGCVTGVDTGSLADFELLISRALGVKS